MVNTFLNSFIKGFSRVLGIFFAYFVLFLIVIMLMKKGGVISSEEICDIFTFLC